MRKTIALFLTVLSTFVLIGCGGSGGSSADPLGTDSITFGHKNDQAGNDWTMAMTVPPFSTVVLTAKIKNASGKEVSGREVTFGYVSNPSGSALSHANSTTDGAGEATIIYTAGAGAGLDVVRARISNGAFGNVNIIVSGPTISPVTLNATATVVTPLSSTAVWATVTDALGNPRAGEAVVFSITAGNGGTLTPLAGVTDINGLAYTIYQAGNNLNPDVIGVTSLSSGAMSALLMMKTGQQSGKIVSIAATPPTVISLGSSILKTTVINNAGDPLVGETVDFSILTPLNGSTVLPLTGVTNGQGSVTAIYTSGNNTDSDIIKAALRSDAGINASIIITKTGTGNRIRLTEDPETSTATRLPATDSNCILTALVTLDDGITPVANQPVTFSKLTPLGTLAAPLIVLTDNNGEANVVFTGPGGAVNGETVVKAEIGGAVNGSVAVRIVYW